MLARSNPGDLMIMYGTTMFFIQVTDRPTPDPRLWCCGFCFEGRYGIEGGMATLGRGDPLVSRSVRPVRS